MKCLGPACVAMGICLLPMGAAWAQSSIDELQKELKEATDEHDTITTQNLTNFYQQVDAAMGDPGAAVTLYQQAGGAMPPPTPVTTEHDSETPSEKDARLAQDNANAAALGGVLQLHCGLLHYAAHYVIKSDEKGLDDDLIAWLQKIAPVYPLVGNAPIGGSPSPAANGGGNDSGGHHKKQGDPGKRAQPFNPAEIKNKSMRDSVVGKYLGFKVWGDKEPAGWAVKDLPKLYRTKVLDPLRAKPTDATLAAWDLYIAMVNADEPDNDKWTQTVYPPLQFERACDDYALKPGTDKLDVLVKFIHANTTNPQAADWIARVKGLLDDYGAKNGHPAVSTDAAPMPAPPTTTPGVSVTTEQQGDATIITTHHAPATNAPPQ